MANSISVEKFHTYTGHKDCVYALEIKDEKTFFSAGGDGQVIMWSLDNLDSGTIIAKVPSSIYALHYISRLDLLIIGQNQEGIHLIDLKQKKEIGSLKIPGVAFFDIKSDHEFIYVGTSSGEILVIDLEKHVIVHRLKNSVKSVRSLTISSDTVVAGYSDNYLRVFDKLQFTLKQEVEAHKFSVFAGVNHPNGTEFISVSRDAHFKVWKLPSMNMEKDVVAHMYAINSIAFSPDRRHFVTCSMDKSIKVWDSTSFALRKVIDKARHAGHSTSVNKVIWMEHDNSLVSCSDDRTISIWNINFDN